MPGPAGPRVPDHPARYVMRKLPHVTLLFWILKLIAVTLGETAGDLLGITLQIGYGVTALIFLVFFVVVLVAQVRAERFHSALFWAVVLGTSMVGTEISDFSNRGFGHGSAQNGIGYAWGAVTLTGILARGSVALLALLIALIVYQIVQLRRHPLKPVPCPLNRLTQRTTAAQWGGGCLHAALEWNHRRPRGHPANSPQGQISNPTGPNSRAPRVLDTPLIRHTRAGGV